MKIPENLEEFEVMANRLTEYGHLDAFGNEWTAPALMKSYADSLAREHALRLIKRADEEAREYKHGKMHLVLMMGSGSTIEQTSVTLNLAGFKNSKGGLFTPDIVSRLWAVHLDSNAPAGFYKGNLGNEDDDASILD